MTFLDSDVSTESLKHPDPQTFWNEEEESMSETTITNVTTGGRSGKKTSTSHSAPSQFRSDIETRFGDTPTMF